MMKRAERYSLFGALLVALLVRMPGILWGYNFPTGFYGHHPDEYTHLVNAETLIDPVSPPRWKPHPYAKGLAAHVAAPVLLVRLVQHRLTATLPTPETIISIGRFVSVCYGVATIGVVFLLAKLLFREPWLPHLSAWIMALGGLHVTQSHFYVSDVASLFWSLLGMYLLLLELDAVDKRDSPYLIASAVCFGISYGLKGVIFSLPSLFLVALLYQPRFRRAVQAAGWCVLGFVGVNLASYTPYDIARTVARGGVHSAHQFSWWSNLFLYVIELPSMVSLPIVLLALVGGFLLCRRWLQMAPRSGLWRIGLVVILPLLINGVFIVFVLDHFPRQIVPLIPWISMIAAWGLLQTMQLVRVRRFCAGAIVVFLFAYLALFVFDGERVFIKEPRNEAARWLMANVARGTDISWWRKDWMPGYVHVAYPDRGRPALVVMEMIEANHFLSGVGLRDSYPQDYHAVFGGQSDERVQQVQALFRGKTEYREVARFEEGYFMPEFIVADGLLGNRSRNYVSGVVIFAKAGWPRPAKSWGQEANSIRL